MLVADPAQPRTDTTFHSVNGYLPGGQYIATIMTNAMTGTARS